MLQNQFTRYYEAATRLVGSVSPSFPGSEACLTKTYIGMHEQLETDLSLEIGAHEAGYSIALKERHGDRITACAVEASPKSYAYYSGRIDFAARGVRYLHALVTDEEGCAPFLEYDEPGHEYARGFSSIFARESPEPPSRKVHVRSIKGDTLVREYPDKRNIALWLDVEGAQEKVLRSFSGTLTSGLVNSVYIEVESSKLWPRQTMLVSGILDYLGQFGFSPFLRDNQYGLQYNIIFVHNRLLNQDFSASFKQFSSLLQKTLSKACPLLSDCPGQ